MRLRHRMAASIGLIASAALAALAIATPAQADDNPLSGTESTYKDSAGVYHYTFDPASLPGAELVVDSGATLRSGQCAFEGSGSGAVGTQTLEVGIEVSYDPATCTRELAVATYPLFDVPEAVLDFIASPEDSETDSTPTERAALASWSGSLHAWLQDPVAIKTTETKSTHNWNSSGGATHGNNWTWFAASGWGRTGYSTGNTSTATNTMATYSNAVFCNIVTGGAGGTTYANHQRTEFRGYTNGLWDWGYNVTKSDGCADWLSNGYTAVTP